MYLRGKLKITFRGTNVMPADDKTKVVFKAKFIYCRRMQLNLVIDVNEK